MSNTLKYMVVLLLLAGVAWADNRIWNAEDGTWSTLSTDTPWLYGRSFHNGDAVQFLDLEQFNNATQAIVRVAGNVIPSSIVFNNALTGYYTVTGSADAQLGDVNDISRPNITKSGLGVSRVDVPFYMGDVRVNNGSLIVSQARDVPFRIDVKNDGVFDFYSQNETNTTPSGVSLDMGATLRRRGAVVLPRQFVFPFKGTAQGGIWIFDSVTAPSIFVQSNATFRAEGALTAAFTNDTGAVSTFVGGGTLTDLNVKSGRVIITNGVYTIANYATNTSDQAALTLGGSGVTDVTFTGDLPLGYVADNMYRIAETNTSVTVHGNLVQGVVAGQAANVCVTDDATLHVKGNWVHGGTAIKQTIAPDAGGIIEFDGILDFQTTPSTSKTYVNVTNGTVRLGGVHFASSVNTRVQQVNICPGGTLELGRENDGAVLATDANGDHQKGYIMKGGTFRFMDDLEVTQNIFFERSYAIAAANLASSTTNVMDSCGHNVLIKGSFLLASGAQATLNAWTRLEIIDSSERKNGRIIIDGVANNSGSKNQLSNNPEPNYGNTTGKPLPTWGTIIKSGAFRINVSNSSKKGMVLDGGILELPCKDGWYTGGTTAAATLYGVTEGSVIRVFKPAGYNTKAVSERNIVAVDASWLTVDEVLKKTAFEFVDEATGTPIPGATFKKRTGASFIVMYWNPPASVQTLPKSQYWRGGSAEWNESDAVWQQVLENGTTNATQTTFAQNINTFFEGTADITLNYNTNNLINVTTYVLGFSTPTAGEAITIHRAAGSTNGFIRAYVVTNTLAKTTLNVPLSVESEIVVQDGSTLIATNLFTRAEWKIGAGATLNVGFERSVDSFSVVTPFIENRGTMIYNMHGREERMDSALVYQEDAPTARYIFENGTICLDEPDENYMARNGHTNVWIGTGATLRLDAANVLGRGQISPIGLSGGTLLANEDFTFSRGIVCRSGSAIELAHNKNVTFNAGTEISVLYDDTPGANNTSVIDHMGQSIDETGCTSSIILTGETTFYVETGATLDLRMALAGNGTIRKTGGGTLILNNESAAEGFLSIEEGTVEIYNSKAVGFMEVTVAPGACVGFAYDAMPIRMTRAITAQPGSIVTLGCDTTADAVEAINPVRITVSGTMTAAGAIIQTLSGTGVAPTTANGVTDDGTVRTYTKAHVLDALYIDLFDSTQTLIWDKGHATGTWFSVADGAALDSASYWHPALMGDVTLGYNENNPYFVNFCNEKRPSVAFITPADVTVNVAEALLPLSVTFTTNYNGSALLTGVGQIGTEAACTSIRASGAKTVIDNLPTYASSLIVEGGASLTLSDLRNSPDSIAVTEISRIRLGTQVDDLNVEGYRFQGYGVISKIGEKTIGLDLDNFTLFTPQLAVESGIMTLTGTDHAPASFASKLIFEAGDGLPIVQNLRIPLDPAKPDVVFADGAMITVRNTGVLVGGTAGNGVNWIEQSAKNAPIGFEGDVMIHLENNASLSNYCYFVANDASDFLINGTGTVVQTTSFATNAYDHVKLEIGPTAALIVMYHTVFNDPVSVVCATDAKIEGMIGGNGTIKASNRMVLTETANIFVGGSAFGNCATNGVSLKLDVTGAELVLPTTDGAIDVDVRRLGALENLIGATVLRIEGATIDDVPAYKFRMVNDETLNHNKEFAFKVVEGRAENGVTNGVELTIVRATGAVFVLSPTKDPTITWPETIATTNAFATSGVDFAILPDNFNTGTDLHTGVILRDRAYNEQGALLTDGVTRAQLAAGAGGVNDEYWFWFTGDNGCWNSSRAYTLHLQNTATEMSTSYTQFSVTNEVFYGDISGLNYGELGFYVTEDMMAGTTNLMVRLFGSTRSVAFPVESATTTPWLVISVRSVPGVGYDVIYNGAVKTLATPIAGLPQRVIITGVAAVDNLYISLGDPNRDPLFYIHDMTETNGVPVNAPLNVMQEVFDRVVSAAVTNGFTVVKPTAATDPVGVLRVSLDYRHMINGMVRANTNETGSAVSDLAYMLNIPLICTNTVATANGTEYQMTFDFALGINSATIRENDASAYIVLTSDLAGTAPCGSAATPHTIHGYVVVEGCASEHPYASDAVWVPVATSREQIFADDGVNEVPLQSMDTLNYQHYRVKITRTPPTNK